MLEGISTNRLCDASAGCLVAAGQQFVIRYHSRTTQQPEKRLQPREAAELARAGLQIASVYQDRGRELEDFDAARGELDARSALAYAGQVGQPAGSAVYFAVDTDFSAAQIQAAVLPYFQRIAQVFAQAGGGTAYLQIGVYGSGLTCRLVGALPQVDFTWLAEATGWRESGSFDAWHVKQHRNDGETLCALGVNWQRCEAQPQFGQFQPVGFALHAGEGEQRRITEGGGNLRHLPTSRENEPITLLPQGQLLRVLGESAPGWLRVRTTLGRSDVIGHVALSRLAAVGAEPQHDAPPPDATPLPIAQLRENHPEARRDRTEARPFPIGEASRPTRDPAAGAEARVAQLTALGDWLDVARVARWRPTFIATFCNVYAADYCYLARAYLPRVWWTSSALVRLGRGESVPVVYAQTVIELRADDLLAWLIDMGPRFGWRRVFDASALQAAANAGGVGLICADREANGQAGHITVVVPETAAHRAERDADGNVTQPLQSQAGASNHRYGSAGPSWWNGSQFRDRGFFVHD